MRAADDFPAIRARMAELAAERAAPECPAVGLMRVGERGPRFDLLDAIDRVLAGRAFVTPREAA